MLNLTMKREERGWSRNELARRTRMSPGDVGKIERGRLVPYPSQLEKLARALGTPVAEAERLLEEARGEGAPGATAEASS